MAYSETVILGYLAISAIPFFFIGGQMLPDMFSGIKMEDCGYRNRGPCGLSFEGSVGTIYMQVVAAFMMQTSALIYFKGSKQGIIASLGCLIAVMAKHIVVDGLIPPPPVMVLTALTMVAQFAAPGEWGKRVFVFYCCFNALVFSTNPLMVLQDTTPR